MDMRNFEQCRVMTKLPSWTFLDVFCGKVLPERFGGGRLYARGFKDAWVKNIVRLSGRLLFATTFLQNYSLEPAGLK